MSLLDRKYFRTEKAAFAHLESLLWADGVVCPHCRGLNTAGRLKGVKDKEGRERLGLWKCYVKECRKQFTVTVGTVFESRHIPLHKMLQAVYLMSASKKGCSAHQLHRTLEVTYKTAWFLAHRIREAMRSGSLTPLGGEGKIVEADETFLQDMDIHKDRKAKRGIAHKRKVLTLIERGGSARSFHVENLTGETVAEVVRTNIRRESSFMTDEARHYKKVGKEFARYESVEHGDEEYVRGDAHVNTAESFFALFKRGMKGVYQHCGEKHLHRYLAEFDFRHNNRVKLGVGDEVRTENALRGIVGKRLTYRAADPQFEAPPF